MSSAGHRVLVDAVIGREHPACDIVLVAGSGDDHQAVDLAERSEVGSHGAHRCLVWKHHDGAAIPLAAEKGVAAHTERLMQARDLSEFDRKGWKIELEEVAGLGDRQNA